jgi:hypothetical protein
MAAALLQLQRHLPAMVGFALLLALPLTLLLSWGVLGFYQRALLRWMGRNPPPALAAPGAPTPGAPPPPLVRPAAATPAAPTPPLALLRQRERRHWLALALLWLLIGLSAALLYLPAHGIGFSPFKLLAIGLVWAAPGWLQLALMARLPWQRGLGLVLAGFAGLFVLILPLMIDTSGASLLQLIRWLLVAGLLPLAALTLLIGIPSLRASAPLLYGPVAGLTLLATLGQPLLMGAFAAGLQRWPLPLGAGVQALPVLALLPPLLAGALPLHALSRAIATAYRRGWLSDHSFSLAASALLVLLLAVAPGWAGSGLAGLLPLLAWLWVPLAIGWLLPRFSQAPPAPATPLLVLRLFRRPGPVGWLFDQVVQRWRFVGPVLLITASDLAARTLDADELVQFLEGRLGERFIASPDQLPPPPATAAGHDGRFPVQEYCCYDSSWQAVLEALLQRSQVVLMDLRGFGPAHGGCLHELGRLGASAHLQRVVLLADASTDRATAAEAFAAGTTSLAAGEAPALQWVEERRRRHPTMEAVLAALTANPPACAPPATHLA